MNETFEKRPGAGIKLAGINDLLGIKEDNGKQITYIPVEKIHPFNSHPFKVQNDAEFKKLLLSIANNGIITPVLVREKDGEYELISGHRRYMAAKQLGLLSVPASVKNMDDDKAIIEMVDSNIQREGLRISEKAQAYKMKYDAYLRLGLLKGDAVASMANLSGEDERTIRRYINLSRMLIQLLEYVDEGQILIVAAEMISGLGEEEQVWIYEAMTELECGIDNNQAQEITSLYKSGELTRKEVDRILSQTKAKFPVLKLNLNEVRHYFNDEPTKRDMQIIILKLLDRWMKEGHPDVMY